MKGLPISFDFPGNTVIRERMVSISIRDSEAERLAREMAECRGVTNTQVATEALKDKYQKEPDEKPKNLLVKEIMEIAHRCGRRRILDHPSEDEILGYNDFGTFEGFRK